MDDGHIEVLAFDNRDLAQILSHTRSHKGRQLDTTLWREHSGLAALKLLECSGVHSYFLERGLLELLAKFIHSEVHSTFCILVA